MPAVWPREVRESWVSLLGAGASAVPILEALDHVGILSELIPGWEQVRSAPQRNPIHQFTSKTPALLATHPDIEDRIARLRNLGG